MKCWNTHRDKILSEQIPTEPYYRSAYDFAESWLQGQEHFTITTSGSTGAPKEILLNRDQMIASARLTGKVLDLPAGSRALVCLHVNYIAGMMMLVRGLELAWQLTIVEPSSNPLLGINNSIEFGFTALVPMQLSVILQNESTRERVGALGKILLGGAPVPKVLEHKIMHLEAPVYQSYGMTETVSHVALRRLNGVEPQEDYHVLPGIEFGTDERDCLYLRGPMTNSKLVQTNDLVKITSPTTFTWLGRADSVINSGGVKISLDEVDEVVGEVLHEMEVTAPHFCWHEPDKKLGQRLVLFLEGKVNILDKKVFLEKISYRVKRYETPKAIYFANQFIKTPTAKIDRAATAQNYPKASHD